MTEAPSCSTAPETLVDYHGEVAEAVAGLAADLAHGTDVRAAVGALDRRLVGPAAAVFLDGTTGGREAVLDAVRRRLERPGPQVPSNPRSPADVARILLLHRVDALWWGHLTPYADARAVRQAKELLPMHLFTRPKAGEWREYDFAVQPRTWWGRGRERVRRRLRPDDRPAVAGLRFTEARLPMIGVLTRLGEEFHARSRPGMRPIWVNSVVRSVEHQTHLASLGYLAELPSAHCVGWAADLEVQWFERFGAADTLRGLLLEQRDAGLLNVIDEGQAWHICVSPDHPVIALAEEI